MRAARVPRGRRWRPAMSGSRSSSPRCFQGAGSRSFTTRDWSLQRRGSFSGSRPSTAPAPAPPGGSPLGGGGGGGGGGGCVGGAGGAPGGGGGGGAGGGGGPRAR